MNLYDTKKIAKQLNKNRFLIQHIVDILGIEPIYEDKGMKLFDKAQFEAIEVASKDFVSVKEMETIYDRNISNIHRLLKAEDLNPFKFGTQFYFTKEQLEIFERQIANLEMKSVTMRNVNVRHRLPMEWMLECAEAGTLPFFKNHLDKWVLSEESYDKLCAFPELKGMRTDLDELLKYMSA